MIIVEHVGKKGARGQNGTNGLGVDSVGGYKIKSPYFAPFRKNAISNYVDWARGTEAAFEGRYDEQQVVQPLTSKQVINYTTVDETNWFDPFGFNVWSVTATGVTDPFSGTEAVEITIGDTTVAGRDYTLLAVPQGATVGRLYRVSFYAQLVSGTILSCKGGVGNISSIPDGNIDLSLLDSTWRRFDVITSAVSIDEFNLYFETTGAVLNIFQINATEGSGLYSFRPAIGNAPVLIDTGSKVYRENKNGFLIEPSSTNLCLYSEDFRQWSVTGGASVSINPQFDGFGGGGSYTRLTFASATAAVLSISGLDLVAGVEYSVSFSASVGAGSVASIGVSLGGGESEGVEQITQSRVVVKCVAGASNTITLTITTSQSGTVLNLAGVQVEQSEPTGYIPTLTVKRERVYDSVSIEPSKLPSLKEPFTVHCKWFDVRQDNATKFIFNAADSLYLNITGANAIVYGDGVELINTAISDTVNGDLFIVFDGVNMSLHTPLELLAATSYNGESSKPSFVQVGSLDGLGSNVLNGSINSLTFWDYAISQNDMKLIGEQ